MSKLGLRFRSGNQRIGCSLHSQALQLSLEFVLDKKEKEDPGNGRGAKLEEDIHTSGISYLLR